MPVSQSSVSHLLGVYGYWAVLVFAFLESMGVPVPAETMLIAASLYAGATHHLAIQWVIAAAAAGAILGDNTGYAIGREGGFRVLRRYGHYIGLNERKLKLGQYLFRQHGGKVVFFGRFVSVLRAWAAFLAGVNRMPWPRFLVFNAAGGILWAFIYGLGAYLLGKNVSRFSGPMGIVVGIVTVLVVAALLILLWRNEQRLEDEAERALPGPLEGTAGRPRARQSEETHADDRLAWRHPLNRLRRLRLKERMLGRLSPWWPYDSAGRPPAGKSLSMDEAGDVGEAETPEGSAPHVHDHDHSARE